MVEPLIEILRDGSWWERLCAASALGYVGDPRAVEPLIEAMRHGEVVSLRETAQEALGRIDDQRAKRALSDDHPESE